MIIIPEIEVVLLLVPRTGTGSLRRAVRAKYRDSMMIYRHMEADGVPPGYDRWTRIGVVREPLERLWSLYKFLKTFGLDGNYVQDHAAIMRDSVRRPFGEWVLHNEVVFHSPHDRANKGRYYPQFNVRNPLPENRKSQWITLRPDLGTQIYQYGEIDLLAQRLGVTLERHHNATGDSSPPPISQEVVDYMDRVFDWDIWATSRETKPWRVEAAA